MSYSTGGKAGAYHDSLPPDGSGAASLSSHMNRYDSELASSSQPSAENVFYRDGNQYSLSHDHGVQHEQLTYEPEGFQSSISVSMLPRSSPIAIQRASGDRYREVESDVDDDDSDIDVEGDAIKLRRKYGNKIIQTYVPESKILQSSSARRHDKSSVLNAPYLGSLSKSTNQVLSLPPMSLAGDSTFLDEPPDSIVSYGSLRDSHERGRFLDGPSSYREPMSGKIRQLDHRLRYHGRQPELNIGERLQQSRKQKELRRKNEKSNGNIVSNNDREKTESKETTSSLSAMMRDASKNNNPASGGTADEPKEEKSFLGTEHLVPIQSQSIALPHSQRPSIPRNMLSTSLTAFELLKSSNTDTSFQSNNTSNSSYSATFVSNDTRTPMKFSNSSGFQPLARSMSDPSPRFQSLSLSEIPAPIIPTVGLAAQMADLEQHGSHPPLQQQKQGRALFFDSGEQRSQHLDHDPNTDGAFGDMDL